MPKLRIASFNIGACCKKDGGYSHETLIGLAEIMREVNADVIGLQEVDCGCDRSARIDMPREFSGINGFPYFFFAPIRPYQNGIYGTLLLSRFPILASGVIPYRLSVAKQGTSCGYIAFRMQDGTPVTVFNTHLSCESEEANTETMCAFRDALFNYRKKYRSFLFSTGDFNSFPEKVQTTFSSMSVANRELKTYEKRSAIDNILYQKQSSAGTTRIQAVYTADAVSLGYSDHDLLAADFQLDPVPKS